MLGDYKCHSTNDPLGGMNDPTPDQKRWRRTRYDDASITLIRHFSLSHR